MRLGTTISHISYSGFRPQVSLTPAGRIKIQFGRDTSVSLDEQLVEELEQDLLAARERLAVLGDRAEIISD